MNDGEARDGRVYGKVGMFKKSLYCHRRHFVAVMISDTSELKLNSSPLEMDFPTFHLKAFFKSKII